MKETNRKKKTMAKTKTDPVREFQKQAVDQRICLFYVADRVKSILEDNKNNNDKMRSDLEQKINGVIKYMPAIDIRKEEKPEV